MWTGLDSKYPTSRLWDPHSVSSVQSRREGVPQVDLRVFHVKRARATGRPPERSSHADLLRGSALPSTRQHGVHVEHEQEAAHRLGRSNARGFWPTPRARAGRLPDPSRTSADRNLWVCHRTVSEPIVANPQSARPTDGYRDNRPLASLSEPVEGNPRSPDGRFTHVEPPTESHAEPTTGSHAGPDAPNPRHRLTGLEENRR